MEVCICGTPSSPRALIPQSLCPRVATQAVKGPPHPPLRRLPPQVLWPQLGSRGHGPTPAQPKPPQNHQGQPCPLSQLEEPRPKEAIKMSAGPSQPTTSRVTF